MEHYLRGWREDAARKGQYDTAIFIGDKVLALTSSEQDVLRLAQLYFDGGSYSRAHDILARHDLIFKGVEYKQLAAHCYVKQNRFEEALTILGDKTPSHLTDSSHKGRRKLTIGDVHSRKPSVKTGKKLSKSEPNGVTVGQDEDQRRSTRLEAGMSYLRGLCHAKLNAFDAAKECYMDAVRIDVQCFEAFDQLMKNSLMSPGEEWDFLESLNFESISMSSVTSDAQQAADLTRMLYVTRLSKFKNPQKFTAAVETLSTHYNLQNNADLLLSRAELLFTQCRFRAALNLTTQILEQNRDAVFVLPIHLACLHELAEKNALFLLAHDFANRHPSEPASWLAVGVYYLTIGKIADARRFFSKSSMMDPHFGPAWIGFAHTFAAEGEHDQAISAYSTAARLFQGTHLPQLFLGMQSLQNANTDLAKEFLGVARTLCDSDPLLLNELGVVFYHEDLFEKAISFFIAALDIAGSLDSDPGAYTATRINLGHAYRRSQRWDDALECFDGVLRAGQGQRDSGVFCAKALVLLELAAHDEAVNGYLPGEDGPTRTIEAIATLHEALAITPQDPVANELLLRALEESALESFPVRSHTSFVTDDAGLSTGDTGRDGSFSQFLEQKKKQAMKEGKTRATSGTRKGKGKALAPEQRSASSQ